MSDDNGPDSIPAKGKIPTKEEEIAAAEDDEEDDEEDEDGEEYRVELIRKHRFAGGRLEYQVKWLGYEKVADMTWEPIENLCAAPLMLLQSRNHQLTHQTETTRPKP